MGEVSFEKWRKRSEGGKRKKRRNSPVRKSVPVRRQPQQDRLRLSDETRVILRRSGNSCRSIWVGNRRRDLERLIRRTDGRDSEASRSDEHGTEDDGDARLGETILELGDFGEEGEEVAG